MSNWEEKRREEIREILLSYFGTDKSMVYANLKDKIISQEKQMIREIMIELFKGDVMEWNIDYENYIAIKKNINKLLSDRKIDLI